MLLCRRRYVRLVSLQIQSIHHSCLDKHLLDLLLFVSSIYKKCLNLCSSNIFTMHLYHPFQNWSIIIFMSNSSVLVLPFIIFSKNLIERCSGTVFLCLPFLSMQQSPSSCYLLFIVDYIHPDLLLLCILLLLWFVLLDHLFLYLLVLSLFFLLLFFSLAIVVVTIHIIVVPFIFAAVLLFVEIGACHILIFTFHNIFVPSLSIFLFSHHISHLAKLHLFFHYCIHSNQ